MPYPDGLVRSSEAAFDAAIIWLYEPMVEACESGANRRLAGIRQRWTPSWGAAASECAIDRRGSGVASSLPGGWLAARVAVRSLPQPNLGPRPMSRAVAVRPSAQQAASRRRGLLSGARCLGS